MHLHNCVKDNKSQCVFCLWSLIVAKGIAKEVFVSFSMVKAQGDHSLLYFAYTCVGDLIIGEVIYLAKKILR